MTSASRVLLVMLAAAPRVVPAQPANVAAETLFREGKRLMKDGNIAAACQKFEASERVDESIGTLLNLADCREKNDQLATAWATFLKAASAARAAGDGARESEARKRSTALEPRLAYLTISVPEASHVDGLVIKRGQDIVDPALWNQGVPIDIGTYEISGQAPGHEPWSTKVVVTANGQRTSVEVPRFKQLKDLRAAVPTVAEPPAPARDDDRDDDGEPPPAPPSRFTRLRKLSIASAAVGVAGLGAGVGFGLASRSQQRQADAICPTTTCSDSHALALNASAQRAATAADIALGVGGAAIAGAAVLWFVGAPSHAAIAPAVSHDQVGVTVVGVF